MGRGEGVPPPKLRVTVRGTQGEPREPDKPGGGIRWQQWGVEGITTDD